MIDPGTSFADVNRTMMGAPSTRALSVVARHNASSVATAPKSPSLAMMRARKIMNEARKIKAVQRHESSMRVHRGPMSPTISKSSSGESSSDVSSNVYIETVARVGKYIDTLQGKCADSTQARSGDIPPTGVPPVAIPSRTPPLGDIVTRYTSTLANARNAMASKSWEKKSEPPHIGNLQGIESSFSSVDDISLILSTKSSNESGANDTDRTFPRGDNVPESSAASGETNDDRRAGGGTNQIKSGPITPTAIALPALYGVSDSSTQDMPALADAKAASTADKKREPPRRDNIEPSKMTRDETMDESVTAKVSSMNERRNRFNSSHHIVKTETEKAKVTESNVLPCETNGDQRACKGATQALSGRSTPAVIAQPVNLAVAATRSSRTRVLGGKTRHTPAHAHAKAASMKRDSPRRDDVEPPTTKLIDETSFANYSEIDVALSHNFEPTPVPVSSAKVDVSDPNMACSAQQDQSLPSQVINAHIATDSSQTSILVETKRVNSTLVNVRNPRARLVKKGELAFRKKRHERSVCGIISPKVSTMKKAQNPIKCSPRLASPKAEKKSKSNAAHREPNGESEGSEGGIISPKVSTMKKALNPINSSPILVQSEADNKSKSNVAHRESNGGMQVTVGPLSIKKDVNYYAVLSQIQKAVRLDNVSVSLGKILAASARRGMSLDAVTEMYKLEMLKARDHSKSGKDSKSSVRDDIRKKKSSIDNDEMIQKDESNCARTNKATSSSFDNNDGVNHGPSPLTSRRRQVSMKSDPDKVAADMQELLSLCDEVKALFSTSIKQTKSNSAPAKNGNDHSVNGGGLEDAPAKDGSDHSVTGEVREKSSQDEDDNELGIPGLTDAQLNQLTQLVNRAEGLKEADLPPQVWVDDDVKQSLRSPWSIAQNVEEIDAFFSRFSIQDDGEQEQKQCKDNTQNNDEGAEAVENESAENYVHDEQVHLDKNLQNKFAGSGPRRNPLVELSVGKNERIKKVDTSIRLPDHLGLWKSPWQSNGVTAPDSIYFHGTRRQCFVPREKRLAGHSGYLNVDFYSLYETTVVNAEDEEIDRAPWEFRDVGQRFLHEKSLESRNWFGKKIISSRIYICAYESRNC